MSHFFETPSPFPRGMGLCCQAITGADGLHGTDVGTKNQKQCKWHFWNQRVEGVGKVVICPFSMKINC